MSASNSRHPALQRLFPFLRWWPQLDRGVVRADLLAGLIGALVVLPQGVAFATLAGMPPEYGLYCAMIPAVVAALWGSSMHAVTGPTNAVSLIVFATLAPLAVPGSPEYISLALTLAFMCGVMMLALGIFGLGALVNFISHTVVVGFTAGAGLLIIASQLHGFLGIDIPRGSSFLKTFHTAFTELDTLQPWTLAVGLTTVAAGLAGRRWFAAVPYMITAMVAGSLVAAAANAALGAERTGIRLLGALPEGLPPLSHPDISLETLQSLTGIAIAVTLLGLTEAISIGRSIGIKSGQRIDGNQEFIGQGLSNIAASFFSGYPSAASFNRSGVNYEAGARTPLSCVFAAVLLAIIVLAVAPLAAHLPLATMSGILFLVAAGLINPGEIRKVVSTSRSEAGVLFGTLVATLLLNLEIAILVGVIGSLLLYLHRTSRPHMRSIVPDPRHPQRKVTEVEDNLRECPQLKLLRIEGAIYFGAANHVEQHFETLREVAPGQKHLLVMAKSINFVDLAGADLLAREAKKRRAEGGALYFYSLRKPVEEMFERGGYIEDIGRERIYHGKLEAIAGVVARLDRAVCARCTARIFTECASLPAPDPG